MQLLQPETKMQSTNSGVSSPAAPEIDPCADAVLNVVAPIARAMRKMMREHRLPELSVPQFRTLALLSFDTKTCLSTVADYIGSSLPAASRMVDGLVAKNLVARTPCPDDRRQISLQLTPLGLKYFRESRQATRLQFANQLASLSSDQKKGIVEAMGLLAEIFGTDAELPARALAESANGNSKAQN
jgi:DNA-binding MarR family transcriptional regulator